LHALLLRFSAWTAVTRAGPLHFDWQALKKVWRFSAGMGGIALSGLVLSQADKIILSKMVDLPSFGHYMLATTVAGSLYILVTPLFNVLYPRFSALVATGETEKLAELYQLGILEEGGAGQRG